MFDRVMSLFTTDDKDAWKWTAMIMQPEPVTEALFRRAVEVAAQKKDLPGLARARFESFHEGLSAQTMFIGPYAAEGPTIEKLHRYIADSGYVLDGLTHKHHEIYMSDPRRTAPEKLKTVIRQPMAKRLV